MPSPNTAFQQRPVAEGKQYKILLTLYADVQQLSFILHLNVAIALWKAPQQLIKLIHIQRRNFHNTRIGYQRLSLIKAVFQKADQILAVFIKAVYRMGERQRHTILCIGLLGKALKEIRKTADGIPFPVSDFQCDIHMLLVSDLSFHKQMHLFHMLTVLQLLIIDLALLQNMTGGRKLLHQLSAAGILLHHRLDVLMLLQNFHLQSALFYRYCFLFCRNPLLLFLNR